MLDNVSAMSVWHTAMGELPGHCLESRGLRNELKSVLRLMADALNPKSVD